MSYHAIGKEAWDELPNLFGNTELATALEADPTLPRHWWGYTYMIPHSRREGVRCHMEAGITYSPLTGLFTKTLQNKGTA